MENEQKTVGVIGGSGLYEMDGFNMKEEIDVDTPFGKPSDKLIMGTLNNVKTIFLPRHGRGHRFPPSAINYRANIFALKMMGANHILSISAVGSMKMELAPGDIVIVDQFVDHTKRRKSSFFLDDIAVHVGFADPVCKSLSKLTKRASERVNIPVIDRGTYICIEGPQFSTRAESNIYRSWGVDVIGMTNATEAKLAKEAEICYSTIALVTDYDCWHETEEDVTVTNVIEILNKNVGRAKEIVKSTISIINEKEKCGCSENLKFAIITTKEKIGKNAEHLKPFFKL